jgi:hypothetical protein
MDFVIQQANRIRKRLKYSNAKVRRLRRKVKSLSEVVAALKKNDLISSGCETLLQSTFSGVCTIRLHHLAKQKTAAITGPKVRKQLTKLVLFKGQ